MDLDYVVDGRGAGGGVYLSYFYFISRVMDLAGYTDGVVIYSYLLR